MVRLIDADALIKATVLNPRHSPYITIIDVDDAPTVGGWICVKDTVDGWISVKDRLPKSLCNKVLVWLEHEGYNGDIEFGH